jgi:hypothetical protein
MAIIGLLPASGKASRMGGVPKFCLPISASETLLHWHVQRMAEVCDEVRVCTRSIWSPLLKSLELPITLYLKEPSTMSDAVVHMSGEQDADFIVGMPDTIVRGGYNFYHDMATASQEHPNASVVLAAFECPPRLRGEVGQIDVSRDGVVRDCIDKEPDCQYAHLWGGLLLRGEMVRQLDRSSASPSRDIAAWTKTCQVRAARCAGEYVDVGRPESLHLLGRDV